MGIYTCGFILFPRIWTQSDFVNSYEIKKKYVTDKYLDFWFE